MRLMRGLPLLIVLLGATLSSSLELTIKTPQGKISGIERQARNGDSFAAFLGVPFARPPVGELRFRAPVPAGQWEGLRDGTTSGDECLQNVLHHPSVIDGSEDCLFVNVFTRHPGDGDASRPVVVWVHGGAFIFGGAKLYNPEYLMENDVVVVVVQYRLNIFGFLSAEDADLPGNYGMKDQQEALRWVQKNIRAYGGDPNKVGLFGMSAGGASVHYHMLSPGSAGLFKAAISLSGSALNWWANVPQPRQQAEKLAEHFGCSNLEGTGLTLSKCLQRVAPLDLMESHRLFFDWRADNPAREPMNVFSPRSDPEAHDPFLPNHPIVAMEKGLINNVPYMVGYAEKEGNWRINYVTPDNDKIGKELWSDFSSKWDKLGPLVLGLFGDNAKDLKSVMTKVNRFYGLDKLSDPPTEDEVEALVDASGDTMFNYGIDVTAKLHAANARGPTFFEFVTYPAEHTLALFRTDDSIGEPPYEVLKKATHGTDMLFMWNMFPFPPMGDRDEKVSRKYNKMILDFLLNGKSTLYPDWKPLGKDPSDWRHLHIDEDFQAKEGLPFKDRIDFWRGLDVYWNATLPGRGAGGGSRDEL